ncbi:MAG: hypothetical protein C0471_01920, partial [Erythrobacter sp.]|nr:hypothetical protein [Erythrobacter sp.]
MASAVLIQPVLAQQVQPNHSATQPTTPALPPVPAPRALQTAGEVPWLYRGSDIPVDDKWLFGEMDNGLRYAVRRN